MWKYFVMNFKSSWFKYLVGRKSIKIKYLVSLSKLSAHYLILIRLQQEEIIKWKVIFMENPSTLSWSKNPFSIIQFHPKYSYLKPSNPRCLRIISVNNCTPHTNYSFRFRRRKQFHFSAKGWISYHVKWISTKKKIYCTALMRCIKE